MRRLAHAAEVEVEIDEECVKEQGKQTVGKERGGDDVGCREGGIGGGKAREEYEDELGEQKREGGR